MSSSLIFLRKFEYSLPGLFMCFVLFERVGVMKSDWSKTGLLLLRGLIFGFAAFIASK